MLLLAVTENVAALPTLALTDAGCVVMVGALEDEDEVEEDDDVDEELLPPPQAASRVEKASMTSARRRRMSNCDLGGWI